MSIKILLSFLFYWKCYKSFIPQDLVKFDICEKKFHWFNSLNTQNDWCSFSIQKFETNCSTFEERDNFKIPSIRFSLCDVWLKFLLSNKSEFIIFGIKFIIKLKVSIEINKIYHMGKLWKLISFNKQLIWFSFVIVSYQSRSFSVHCLHIAHFDSPLDSRNS